MTWRRLSGPQNVTLCRQMEPESHQVGLFAQMHLVTAFTVPHLSLHTKTKGVSVCAVVCRLSTEALKVKHGEGGDPPEAG